jgi:HAD superfamily hydrolase (TIGR01509 family)
MKRISTVFWDLDGTLIDSEAIHEEASHFGVAQLGYPQIIHQLPAGLENTAAFECLFAKTALAEPQLFAKWEQYAIDYAYERIGTEQQIIPSGKLFRQLAERGIKQSVVSNSGRLLVEHSLRQIGLLDLCYGTFTRDDVPHGKPNPQLYLNALAHHQVGASECLTFEDSSSGITAAKKAEIEVVGVGIQSASFNPVLVCSVDSLDWSGVLGELYEFKL